MVVDNEEEPVEGVPLEQYRAWLDEDSNLSPSPLRDLSGGLGGQEEEEEQRWLDALEKGELDDNGDLKKEINERLLTARQVSRFILYLFAKLMLRAFHIWRTLQGSRDISSGEKTDKVSVLMELVFLCSK